jgi:hypothetical protein
MNTKFNVVLVKEIKDGLNDKKFIMSMLLNIIIFSVIGYGIDYLVSPEGLLVPILTLILYPPLSMWILSFPFIQEKFWNEKLLHGFQPLLTLPINLKTIWVGKLAAIFVLTYPSTAIIITSLSIAYYLCLGINPFLTLPLILWISVFILIPTIVMIYNAVATLIALKFSNQRIIDLLQYITIGIFALLFVGTNKIINILVALHLTDWILVLGGFLVSILIMGIVFYFVNNLSKEDAIN